MTAASVPAGSARPVPSDPARRISLAGSARLLRLELRRNVMLWILPLAIALFFFDSYRTTVGMLPYWGPRAITLQLHAVIDFAPFVAGAAAWMGSREGRRNTRELVAVTAVSRWSGGLASWVATAGWAEAAYLGCVATVYLTTAGQHPWGGPLWWPPAVGAAAVAACTAMGFAAGALFSSRFTAPLVSVVALVVLVAAIHPPGGSAYALVSPVNSTLGLNLFPGIAVFYRYLPDVAIAEVMFLAGLTVTALGTLGLPAASGGRRARRLGAAVTLAGLAATGTAIGLAGTARVEAYGMMQIPALHDAASDRPVPYVPVCRDTGIPVCVHPAFGTYLPTLTTALGPVLREVAGLPGAPVRAVQVTTPFHLNDVGYITPSPIPVMSGRPPVVRLSLGSALASGSLASLARSSLGPGIVVSVVAPAGTPSPAQQAVAVALLKDAGLPLTAPPPAAYAAAMRFAALPAATRHAWLAARLPALRAGHVALTQIP